MLWQERDWVDFLGERILEERKDLVMGYKIREVYELQIDYITDDFSDELKKEVEKVYYRLTNCRSVTERWNILALEEFVEILLKIDSLNYVIWDNTIEDDIDLEFINKALDDLIKALLTKYWV